MLPKILITLSNGGVYLQKVRCGKKNCRCASGNKHNAYYYFNRVDGKLTKKYIRKAQLKEITAEANVITDVRNSIRHKSKLVKEQKRHLRLERKARKEAGIKEEPFDWKLLNQLVEMMLKNEILGK